MRHCGTLLCVCIYVGVGDGCTRTVGACPWKPEGVGAFLKCSLLYTFEAGSLTVLGAFWVSETRQWAQACALWPTFYIAAGDKVSSLQVLSQPSLVQGPTGSLCTQLRDWFKNRGWEEYSEITHGCLCDKFPMFLSFYFKFLKLTRSKLRKKQVAFFVVVGWAVPP